eukprot:scaffold4372_cov397-Prasinococcus_capsulatus_cf.AAC.24
MKELKNDRPITPRIHFVRGGLDNVDVFDDNLIEEQDVNGGTGGGLVGFLDRIAAEVRGKHTGKRWAYVDPILRSYCSLYPGMGPDKEAWIHCQESINLLLSGMPRMYCFIQKSFPWYSRILDRAQTQLDLAPRKD